MAAKVPSSGGVDLLRRPRRIRRSASGWALGVIVSVVVVAGGSAAHGQDAVPPPEVPASELERQAVAGEVIDQENVTITGDLDLRAVGRLSRPLRCRDCIFSGSVTATDVLFERLVDLTRSTVAGEFRLDGAVFEAPANFDEAHFQARVDLTSARFADSVSFNGAEFSGPAAFDRAQVKGSGFFADGSFRDETSFNGTEFLGRSDFGNRRFSGTSHFQDTVFGGGAFFTSATFVRRANFESAEFRGTGSFRRAEFKDGACFDHLGASGALDFGKAEFDGGATFDDLASFGSMTLTGIRIEGGDLSMKQISVRDLTMEVATTGALQDERPKRPAKNHQQHESPAKRHEQQKSVLALIERSAQARDDFGAANQARYLRMKLEGEEDGATLHRVLDNGVYGAVFGYLVDPKRPFVWLIRLLFLGGALRLSVALWRWKTQPDQRASDTGSAGTAPRQWLLRQGRGAVRCFSFVIRPFGVAFTVALRRTPGIKTEDIKDGKTFLCWAEFAAYKVLLVVSVLALGKSNATVREVLSNVGL